MMNLRRKTLRLRHAVVKAIAPKLYMETLEVERRQRVFTEVPRPMIKFLSQRDDDQLAGAEIGVAEGVNAHSILTTLPIEKLYLIDPYIPYIQDGKLWTRYTDCYEKAMIRLSPFSDRIVWILKTSDEAVGDVPNDMDFVYIDGNHSYEYVKRDVENYFPKVRNGGVIGGHDFEPSYEGVRRAVLEFIHKHAQEISEVHVERADWWVVKK